jgi:very-short-patch-repair endonuclease
MGRLHSLHRGVYAVGHRDVSPLGRFLAAVLAVGEGAVLSHISAAILWGFWPRAAHQVLVDVSVARNVRPRAGIRLRKRRALPSKDTTRRAGIPVTTPARTALDLAATLSSDRLLARTVHEAQVQRCVNQRQLAAQVARDPCHRGTRRVARLISPGPVPTRSDLEDRTLEFLDRHGFPRPQTNVLLAGAEVDFLFEDAKLVVETDGGRFHGTAHARAADASKQAILEAAGYRVLRFTWDEVTRRPAQTAQRLRGALEPAGGASPR